GKNSLNRLIRCVCGKKIGPDPRNFNQRVSLGRNDLLIRTFPNKDVQSYLDCPSKPAGITLFSEREILSVHANRLQEINMYIGLPNSDLSKEAYTFTNLVIKPLMEYTRWIHLLPASALLNKSNFC
ncbi:hypothetical protein N8D57_25970, partial [Klebsiella pneumoniae]|nr:hypothetical protein [Klebsiella pneumoniae]MCT9971378.1 hypothetical protein [Klebsiella pneumoniae]MCU0088171.1 hypothetical protein [Klebsiella pneumoniae]MCU0113084.1 hypothetical protein [Klebsiella pneumoniae]MCU0137385.1 hypothetical protein [Klebsiella pneumoniae]